MGGGGAGGHTPFDPPTCAHAQPCAPTRPHTHPLPPPPAHAHTQLFLGFLTYREAYPRGDTDFHKSLQLYRTGERALHARLPLAPLPRPPPPARAHNTPPPHTPRPPTAPPTHDTHPPTSRLQLRVCPSLCAALCILWVPSPAWASSSEVSPPPHPPACTLPQPLHPPHPLHTHPSTHTQPSPLHAQPTSASRGSWRRPRPSCRHWSASDGTWNACCGQRARCERRARWRAAPPSLTPPLCTLESPT